MRRLLAIFVVMGFMGLISADLSAQGAGQGWSGSRRMAGGKQVGSSPKEGAKNQQNQAELDRLKEESKRLNAEANQLKAAIKVHRQAGDEAAVRRDTEALREVQQDIKTNRERIRQFRQR
jgi:uncharacterized protein YlxW (UPF0749 family)